MIPLEIPPGVLSVPTIGMKSNRWNAANMMRWENNRMAPLKGQEEVTYGYPFASRVRAIHQWEDNAGVAYTAYLCEGHLYVDVGGELNDVSPTPPIEAPYSDVSAGGYGIGVHGAGTFGTPRPDRSREKKITPMYTLGNWGEDLIAMTSVDGRLLRWSPSTPGDASDAVPNAPTGNRTFIITPERHVILFGMDGDPRTFGWSDQEDIENWSFDDTASKAGYFNVEPASPIVTAKQSVGGTLFFTARAAYIIRPVGLPYVYSYDEIASSSAPISGASIVTVGGVTVWPTESGWWQFDGVSLTPMQCDVWDWIRRDINFTYSRYEAAMVDLITNSEVHFFFVSANSRYNDRLVIFNYREGWWSTCLMGRSCGFGSSYTTYPLMSDGASVFRHEKGTTYPGLTEGPWVESYSINPDPTSLVMFNQMLPDISGDPADIGFRLKVAMNRAGDNVFTETDLKLVRSNGYVDFRSTGRDIRLVVEGRTISGKDWSFGHPLIDLKKRGLR